MITFFLLCKERGIMTQGSKPDIVLSDYWKDKEHFADLCNAVLFDGKQVLLPDDLEERDSDVSSVLKHRKKARSMKLTRDVLKIAKYSKHHGANLAILGIENQDRIHYAMPLRVMEYDTYSYKKQYRENAKKYRSTKNLTKDEFLSGMKRTDKFVPVITIVIYYGEKSWDGARSLKDMLDISPQIEGYVNDYQMYLVELGSNGLPLQNEDNINLFRICGMLYDHTKTLSERKVQIIEYSEENEVTEEVLTAAGAIAGKTIEVDKEEGESMCSFFEELERECEERGKKAGKMQAAVQVVQNMMEKLGVSLEVACEIAEITIECYKENKNKAQVRV